VAEFAESYLILPIIQQEAVDLPPALVILSIVLMGTLAGALGVLVATPLLAALMVLIKMLYVEDRLGDTTVEVATQAGCSLTQARLGGDDAGVVFAAATRALDAAQAAAAQRDQRNKEQ